MKRSPLPHPEPEKPAPPEVARLLALPRGEKFAQAAIEPRWRDPGVVQCLLGQAEEHAAEFAPEGAELARLALALAERLVPSDRLPAPLILDYQAQAWILIGSDAVIRTAPGEAGLAFAVACQLLSAGSGDPLLHGALCFGLALFHWVRSEVDEAFERLDTAQEAFAEAQQPSEEGAVWLRRGFFLQELACPEEARAAFLRGIPMARNGRFRLMAEAAQQALASLGSPIEAAGKVH